MHLDDSGHSNLQANNLIHLNLHGSNYLIFSTFDEKHYEVFYLPNEVFG